VEDGTNGNGITLRPAGDAAISVDVGDRIDLDINRRVHAIARKVIKRLSHVTRLEVNPGYAALLVSYDPAQATFEEVADAIREAAAACAHAAGPVFRFTLPVCYGGDLGPDIADVAANHSLTAKEVVERHTARDYPIFCLGFSPGFPFLGDIDPLLVTPRLETPRARVPAGSVAIGGGQTGVYPTSTPGGWRLIGRTPLILFDVRRNPPVPYRPGDVIRFRPIDREEYERLLAAPTLPQGEPIAAESDPA
jgi:KipI family sensor histidine kinase inhibitor